MIKSWRYGRFDVVVSDHFANAINDRQKPEYEDVADVISCYATAAAAPTKLNKRTRPAKRRKPRVKGRRCVFTIIPANLPGFIVPVYPNLQNVHEASAQFRDVEPATKPRETMQDSPLKSSSLVPTADARAAVWHGILGAAKHLGKRAPPPLRQRPTVVQVRQGTSETPVYFIGAGLYELNTAQMMPPRHSIFAAEIAWPAPWHDAAATNDTDATPVLEDMVVPYVTALRAHAGSTPCVLVGYSFHASMGSR